MNQALSAELFAVDPKIRYVAVNQGGRLTEMVQNPRWPSHNPAESDRMEELIVNPVALELTRRRGDLDLQGVHFLLIRYGVQFQLLFPWRAGHVSVGMELTAEALAVADRIAAVLNEP